MAAQSFPFICRYMTEEHMVTFKYNYWNAEHMFAVHKRHVSEIFSNNYRKGGAFNL